MLDERRWRALWERIGGVRGGASVFAELDAAYSEPHRAYHNTAHVRDCLVRFDEARAQAQRPDEVEAAIWFHDAIYDPRTKDNEERSAEWAASAFSRCGVGGDTISRVTALILSTKHDRLADSEDSALLMDLDLSVLGSEPEAFSAYDAAIRREYGWVPEAEYRAGRAAVMDRFLSRPSIYQTDLFRLGLEAQARKNLARLISSLREPRQAEPGVGADSR